MVRFILKRLGLALITLWLLTVIVFLLGQVLPSDPGRSVLGPLAAPSAVRALDHQLGVDKPLLTQYWNWLSNFPGTSTQYQAPIGPILSTALGRSIKLAVFAFIIVVPLGIFGGVISALNYGKPLDRTISIVGQSALTIPEFVSGIILIVIFAVELNGGRRASLEVRMPAEDRISFKFEAQGDPLRVAADWLRRSDEHFVGLGARHSTQFDQAGRAVQLGADRRYTGPDCPPDLLAGGGIPQGDYAPVPWFVSSRGYAVWIQSDANGIRFDLAGDRVAASTRCNAGPLRIDFLCDPTPAARLHDLKQSGRLQIGDCLFRDSAVFLGLRRTRDQYRHQSARAADELLGGRTRLSAFQH